ncbi:MAG: hypothetical protein AAF697_06860 [Pseudomonadota bacterium]
MNGEGTVKSVSTPLAGRRGGPLAVLAVLLLGWGVARSLLWESPFVLPNIDLPEIDLAVVDPAQNGTRSLSPVNEAEDELTGNRLDPIDGAWRVGYGIGSYREAYDGPFTPQASSKNWRARPDAMPLSKIAAGHQQLMIRGFAVDWHSADVERAVGDGHTQLARRRTPAREAAPPFAPLPAGVLGDLSGQGKPNRWTLDTFGFFRQGSGSLSTSLGRVPVYGASQAAANLQYRAAPESGFDPRGFVRAYRALVEGGETEVATGLSARPIPGVPLRTVAELRVSRNPVGTDYRPAGYVVSELPPQSLPAGFLLETYAAAGYVGGEADTYFADGQAALTREVITVNGPTNIPVRISVGGAGWGGAQRGAERVDVGPTMRVELKVGDVPARISVDWRERVVGEAAPESGLAATISTQF